MDGDKCTVVTGDQSAGLTQSADILLIVPKGKKQEVRSKRQEARGKRQEARGSRHVQELLRSQFTFLAALPSLPNAGQIRGTKCNTLTDRGTGLYRHTDNLLRVWLVNDN